MIEELLAVLQTHREAALWKTEGLSEWDTRRPLTQSGSTLLGMIKHLATMEYEYFGLCARQPMTVLPWASHLDDDESRASEFYALPAESSDLIVRSYRQLWSETDSAVRALGLSHRVEVPWFGSEPVSVLRILAHITAETARHAGHMDILRENLDGVVGWAPGVRIVPQRTERETVRHLAMLEGLARDASGDGVPWTQPTLQTERLTLRPTSADDFDGMKELHADPQAARMMYQPAWTEDSGSRSFATILRETGRRSKQSWTALTEDGEFVGRFILTLEGHGQAEIGWSTSPRHRGLGYAAEAVRTLADHAFDDLGIHRLTAMIDVENAASRRVAEKTGMSVVGRQEESRNIDGEWRSHEIWALMTPHRS